MRFAKQVWVFSIVIAAVLSWASPSFAAEGAEPGMPAGQSPMPQAAGMPALPALPSLDSTGIQEQPLGAPTQAGAPQLGEQLLGQGQTSSGEGTMIPPPLPSLSAVSDTEATAPIAGAPAGPIDLYEFLFMDHEEYGVIRQKVSIEEAKKIKDKELSRLSMKYGAQQPGAAQQQGADPRAFGSWDFYFEQLELYGRYVKEQLLPHATEELPDPDFNVTNQQDAMSKRKDLKTAYDKAAMAEANRQRDENIAFYERLQQREDVRKKYYEWLAQQEQDLSEWATVWGRRAAATRWVASENVFSRDDWYYGTNFGVGQPVQVQIGNQQFVYSAQPTSGIAQKEVNILTTHVSPYDIVGPDGELRNRESELQRGTLVEPPQEEHSPAGLIQVAP